MRTTSSTVLFARQPIIGRDHAIVAYELLYRSASESKRAVFIDNALATADVIDAAFRRIGIHAIVGGTRALVNVDAEFLLSRRIEQLPKEGVMLERLVLRPELAAFEAILRDRVERLGSLEDERLARAVLVKLKRGERVFYKHIDDLTPEDR